MADSPLVTYYYAAPAIGGSQSPNVVAVHSIESPLEPGYAKTLTGPAYFGGSSAGVSSHYVVDPVDTCQGVPENRVAYHVGTGNPGVIAIEQSGRAAFNRDEWMTGNGIAQHRRVAALLADINRRRPLIRLRWLNDDELRAAWNNKSLPGGCGTHNQFRRVIGGTTHHDPWQGTTDGIAYPWNDVMAMAVQIRGGSDPSTPTTPDPVPEDDSMSAADVAELKKYIDDKFKVTSKVTNNPINLDELLAYVDLHNNGQMLTVATPENAWYAFAPGRFYQINDVELRVGQDSGLISRAAPFVTDNNGVGVIRDLVLKDNLGK